MIHAGLFSGIGGFPLAAQWMGWENLFEVEIDDWCRQVLHKNFPTTQLFSNVLTFNATPFRGRIDVLSGGFPCQPFSTAGKGLGDADPRHLWPAMLRIIRECRPRFVLAENVYGLLSKHPLQFERVCADLEAEGYDVQPILLPACAVNAPHRRDRFWFIAHARSSGPSQSYAAAVSDGAGLSPRLGNAESITYCHGDNGRPVIDILRGESHTTGGGIASYASCWMRDRQQDSTQQARCAESATSTWWLTEPGLRSADDGLSARLVRAELKAYGNAIVPQVAYQFFRAIEAVDQLKS